MKWMISLALLASVAAPALAQDGGHHGGGDRGGSGDHGGGRPAPQGQPGPQQAPRPQFQAPQRGPAPDQGPRPQFQPRGGEEGRGSGSRFDGPGRMPPGGQPGGAPNGVQVHRGDVRQPGGWQGGRPDQRPDGRPGWNGNGRPDWQNGRPDHGPDGRPGWNGARPGFAGRPGPDPRGGGWNRGWRDDHRYDWRGWRDTHRSFYHVGGYRPPYGYGWGYRRFDIGGRIDPVFFAQDYWISDPWYYRLPPAEGPYRWVRYYNDALLIDVYSGMVVDSIPDFFW